MYIVYLIATGAILEVVPGCEGVSECICPGDTVIYRCTVQGNANGATIWTGTAFSGCLQDTAILSHNLFELTGGSTATCNNGDIVGQSLGVQGNNYTSQLNVTITPDTAGKTITCAYDALTRDQTRHIKFSTTVPGTTNSSA